MRTCIGMHDPYHNRQIVSQKLFEPILQVLFDTMPRDNLLNSACLELFEFIRRESIEILIKHLVTTYRDKFQTITYVDTFQGLILRYDTFSERTTTQELETSFTSVDSDTPARNVGIVNGNKWGQGLKGLDPEEEAYFNTSDDEDDELPNAVKVNGASPVRPLVNYPDDDGDGDEMDILATSAPSASPLKSSPASQTQGSPILRSASKVNNLTPPERISEKRRREEEEEDELFASIAESGTKRKAAAQSTSNAQNAQKLRRKNSMSSAKDSGAPRKISISIPLKSNGDGGKGD